jgi:hypothetical protein
MLISGYFMDAVKQKIVYLTPGKNARGISIFIFYIAGVRLAGMASWFWLLF